MIFLIFLNILIVLLLFQCDCKLQGFNSKLQGIMFNESLINYHVIMILYSKERKSQYEEILSNCFVLLQNDVIVIDTFAKSV